MAFSAHILSESEAGASRSHRSGGVITVSMFYLPIAKRPLTCPNPLLHTTHPRAPLCTWWQLLHSAPPRGMPPCPRSAQPRGPWRTAAPLQGWRSAALETTGRRARQPHWNPGSARRALSYLCWMYREYIGPRGHIVIQTLLTSYS